MPIKFFATNKRLNKSVRKILRQLSHISLLDINLPNGKKRYSITTVEEDHKKLLDAYNIKRVNARQSASPIHYSRRHGTSTSAIGLKFG